METVSYVLCMSLDSNTDTDVMLSLIFCPRPPSVTPSCKTHSNTRTCGFSNALEQNGHWKRCHVNNMRQEDCKSDKSDKHLSTARPAGLGHLERVRTTTIWVKLASGHISQSIETPTPASRVRMSSIDFGFVGMSAGFVVPRILMIKNRLRDPLPAAQQLHLDLPLLSQSQPAPPLIFAAAESIMMSMDNSQLSSSKTAFKTNASAAPRTSALYSTSPPEVDTLA